MRSWKTMLVMPNLAQHDLTIPVSADEKLDAEQRGIIEFMNRDAGRTEEVTTIPLETVMTDLCG